MKKNLVKSISNSPIGERGKILSPIMTFHFLSDSIDILGGHMQTKENTMTNTQTYTGVFTNYNQIDWMCKKYLPSNILIDVTGTFLFSQALDSIDALETLKEKMVKYVFSNSYIQKIVWLLFVDEEKIQEFNSFLIQLRNEWGVDKFDFKLVPSSIEDRMKSLDELLQEEAETNQ